VGLHRRCVLNSVFRLGDTRTPKQPVRLVETELNATVRQSTVFLKHHLKRAGFFQRICSRLFWHHGQSCLDNTLHRRGGVNDCLPQKWRSGYVSNTALTRSAMKLFKHELFLNGEKLTVLVALFCVAFSFSSPVSKTNSPT